MSFGKAVLIPRVLFGLGLAAVAAMSIVCSGGGSNGPDAAGGQSGEVTDSGSSGGNGTGGNGGLGVGDASAMTGGTPGSGGMPGAGGNPAVICNGAPKLKLTTVAKIKDAAVIFVVQPSKASPIFAVQRSGIISILKAGAALPTPFIDLRKSVKDDGERGLLGLAFHPNYDANGRFFVYYTKRGNDPVAAGPEGNIVIAEGKRSSNAEVADPSVKSLFTIDHSTYGNHNGGMMAFGADGKLFASVGDGGFGGDPFKAAQKPDVPLGKILRIDVDNPSARPEGNMPAPADVHVWAYGLRNPWRWSFDRENGDLYIGDVGQGAWEEVDVVPAAQQAAGLNFGWSVMEGNHCYSGDSCDKNQKILPVTEYVNPPAPQGSQSDPARAVIGGYVYRGAKIPCLKGRYFYGDNATNQVWSFVYTAGKATSPLEVTSDLSSTDTPIQGLSTFGQDADGELYLGDVFGNVYRIDPR